MTEVLVTVNSPGEVATWLEPLTRELLPHLGEGRLTVMIPPCTFASGAEARVVRSFLGDDPRVRVYEPGQVLAWLVLGRRPPGYRPAGQGVVLFLGGDMVYAAWIARRLGYRALAYTEGRVRWTGTFERFLLPDDRALERAHRRLGPRAEELAPRLEVVGDLMVDAAQSRIPPDQVRKRLGLVSGEQVLVLLPGSRATEVRLVLPLYLDGLAALARAPGARAGRPLRAVVALSPFADGEEALGVARRHLEGAGGWREAGAPGAASAGWSGLGLPGSRRVVLAERVETGRPLRVELVQGASRELMAVADLALTLPGSSTAEMAAFGLPMVVVLPLQWPEEIPLEGLPGLVGGIPAIGPALKRRAVRRLERSIGFVALPNRWTGRAVVPELRGEVSPEAIGRELAAWLDDDPRRAALRRELEGLRGEAGAARRVSDRVLTLLKGGAAGPRVGGAGGSEGQEVMP